MSGHTPGEWKVNGYEGHVYVVHNGGPVCRVSKTFTDSEAEFEANAHLIAAAPELLAACQYLVAEIHNGCNRKDEAFMRGVAKAEAIIARAERSES